MATRPVVSVGATEYYAGDSTGSGNYGSIPDRRRQPLGAPGHLRGALVASDEPSERRHVHVSGRERARRAPVYDGVAVARTARASLSISGTQGTGRGRANTPRRVPVPDRLVGPSAQALASPRTRSISSLRPRQARAESLKPPPAQTEAGGRAEGEGEAEIGLLRRRRRGRSAAADRQRNRRRSSPTGSPPPRRTHLWRLQAMVAAG